MLPVWGKSSSLKFKERTITPTAPKRAALAAPCVRGLTVFEYASKVLINSAGMGRLKKTNFPSIFSLPSCSSSSKLLTSTTPARKPEEGVAIDPPRAHTGTFILMPGPVMILAYSKVPLTHLGTITSCK